MSRYAASCYKTISIAFSRPTNSFLTMFEYFIPIPFVMYITMSSYANTGDEARGQFVTSLSE